MAFVLAIDPGCDHSAYAYIMRETYAPITFGKAENRWVEEVVMKNTELFDQLVIEQVASFGLPVGLEVFRTCEAIGRFKLLAEQASIAIEPMFRKQVVMEICETARASDANIRRALIDRFAQFDLKNGKGTKNHRDWFYGFKADCWQAYALGCAYLDMEKRREMQ